MAMWFCSNPKGIPAQSPGLQGTSYPGSTVQIGTTTPTGLRLRAAPTGHNPFGVDTYRRDFPRVARASQPWAGGHNPFGIGASSQAIVGHPFCIVSKARSAAKKEESAGEG